MDDNKIIQSAFDELSGKKIFQVTIPVKYVEPVLRPKQSLWKRMLRFPKPAFPEYETERTFEIWPCVTINQYRIAAAACKLPTELFDDETRMLGYVPQHLPTMIYIIASAIQNDYREPEEHLITFLERNLDNIDIADLLAASLQGTNMQAFTTSIALMNGTASLMKPTASPIDGSE